MSERSRSGPGATFGRRTRKAVRLSAAELVTTRFFDDERKLPAVVEPAGESLRLAEWLAGSRERVRTLVHRHGAVLLRGFAVQPVEELEGIIATLCGGALPYAERSSPRSEVRGRIYTSTDHPADQRIYLHNEQSYNQIFPLKIFFACAVAARQGGQTPLADCRRVLTRIDPQVRRELEARRYAYVRHFGEGFGLGWREAFQTDDPRQVESYCRAREIEVEWGSGEHLTTRQVRRVTARHPVTGEWSWFNHATFFHFSTLPPAVQRSLLAEVDADRLPNQTFYGDGAEIPAQVMDHLRDCYERETVLFDWRPGDVLVCDNLLVAHARMPFAGDRKVVVGMSEPHSWEEV